MLVPIVVVIGLTAINTLVTSLLGIDDDDFYYRNVIKRQAQRRGEVIETDVPLGEATRVPSRYTR